MFQEEVLVEFLVERLVEYPVVLLEEFLDATPGIAGGTPGRTPSEISGVIPREVLRGITGNTAEPIPFTPGTVGFLRIS